MEESFKWWMERLPIMSWHSIYPWFKWKRRFIPPCGHWFNERKNEFIMGNVIDKSFKEIWKSDRYWEVQKKVREIVNVNKDCESNCRQHYINRFLFHEGKNDLSKIKGDYKDHIEKSQIISILSNYEDIVNWGIEDVLGHNSRI